MKIYISGKITGLEKHVYIPRFAALAAFISSKGAEPVNPVEITAHLPEGTSWEEYMKVCIRELLNCDGIMLQSNWTESKGAMVERTVAEAIGLTVFETPTF